MTTLRHLQTADACPALFAASGAFAVTMSKSEYTAAKNQIGAQYKADKAACASSSGNAKDVCTTEAKATHTKALADAKLTEKVGVARKDAAQDKNDANYKVAAQKCESLASDAKASCISAAKAHFNKT